MNSVENLQWDEQGLLPAVVQDVETGEVLMLAYVSRESLARTRLLGETVFYSRSRKDLWHKGETSGNFQKVAALSADCDRDAILIQVRPLGPACHTGARSCFFEEVEGFSKTKAGDLAGVLAQLENVIRERHEQRPEGSYTTKLFEKGTKRILQKVGEEATEMVLAGAAGDRGEVIRETSDLLYHMVVALRALGISLDEVAAELRQRRK